MKFDCDKWKNRKQNWHPYFCWFPIKLGPSDCRWLEYIERKGKYYSSYRSGWWTWDYRV